jgi:cytochrome c556
MIRTVFAVAAVATVALGVTAVVAQQDPIAARKALMKANGDQARIGGQMSRGEAPFEVAKAQLIFTTYAETADKVGALFPDNSKTGGDTAADPKIWQNKADFDGKLKKFGDDAKAAGAATKDLDSFKSNYANVMRNCGGCHETYRIKKS